MIWTKGVDVLIEAHRLLAETGMVINLDLYGNPDPGNPNSVSLETLQTWNRLPNVRWHGVTNDIQSVWKQSDICVVSTRTREGMPRAMLEAAAYGRPLVVTDVPGCRHFVRHGIEGFIAEPDDPQSLADAIKKLVKAPEIRKKMGIAARQRVLCGYTEYHIRTKVLDIYRKLLNR